MKRIHESYCAGDRSAKRFFNIPFGNWDAASKGRLHSPVEPWHDDALAELYTYNLERGASPLALTHIQSLDNPQTFVIATGQQPGFFGGPLYNIYKSLAAVRIAEAFSQRFHVKAVPIFWLASDDHNLDDVASFYWKSPHGIIESASFQSGENNEGFPLFALEIDPQAALSILENLRTTTVDNTAMKNLFADIEQCIVSSRTFEDFFVRVMNYLLDDSGLIFVPPHLKAIRRRSLPVILHELTNPGYSSSLIRLAADRLGDAGFEPTLSRKHEQVNVFIYDDAGKRCRLRRHPHGFAIENVVLPGDGTTVSEADLLSLIHDTPAKISFNVVTRPLVQDMIFPTVAYVGGAGEISYLAQLKDVYASLGIFMPMIVPRPNILLIDPTTARLLEKYHLDISAIDPTNPATFSSFEQIIREKIAGETIIHDTHANIERLIIEMKQHLAGVRDSGVQRSMEKLEGHLHTSFSKLEERYQRYSMERNEASAKHLRMLSDSLFPLSKPQERVFSALSPGIVEHCGKGMTAISETIRSTFRDMGTGSGKITISLHAGA